ncbi:NADPH:quinone oxidoreductase family protein [Antrihabitans sp. YC3-6]|uniref:NADPH:quinone oxidoreductase family protein n=1 Tax=Antrihabitans stalagmiti TaxID=2799499 RepID=A0A934NPA3_9NOCA|nr:NADPH:quinone oxidoreductase family protein [Antrihabitans stalagmiti]MBJ8338854.1 NADPH:quinone oxidoreductase family protein [Antrihabitans stalagmiti]
MRAIQVTSLTGPAGIEFGEVPEPETTGMVSIQVRAVGVCFPDLLISYGKYQMRPDPPFVPGSEIAGVVTAAPEGSEFAVGQRVLATLPFLGGYAERAAAPEQLVLPLPDELSFAEGASMIINYQTMEFAYLRRAKLVAGETVVVLGAAGGVGTAAIQLAKAHGARVIAVVRRDSADDFLRSLGADEVVRLAPGWDGVVRDLAGKEGVSVVVDPVGGDAFDDAVRVLKPEGRLVVIGFAGGSIPTVKINRVLFRNISIVGAAWGEFLRHDLGAVREVHDSLTRLVAAGLRPVVQATYPLADAAQALLDLEEGRVLGKAVLEID